MKNISIIIPILNEGENIKKLVKEILKNLKKIRVFCTGTIKKYQAGPIIQDLIADILNN